ncbi:hypothetical protein HYW87_03410 [Candidatus Roizmanbacteria bacterium]|nr:hypothetical protein [Candidatus Roizmanbacteria bacterium]
MVEQFHQTKDWYPFPSDVAVATSSTLKTQLLFSNGIPVIRTRRETDLVSQGEGVNPVVTFDGESPPFATRTALRKVIPLQTYLQQGFLSRGIVTSRATFDSTNDFFHSPNGKGDVIVTNKHHGERINIDQLMTVFQVAVGAEFVSSTGIAVAYSYSNLLRLYSLRLRVGIWDPKNLDKLYQVVREHPDFPGGMSVILAMRHEFVRTNGFLKLEATRVDETPDLVLADRRGKLVGGKVVSERHVIQDIALKNKDGRLEQLIKALAIGIIPRDILNLIATGATEEIYV